MFERVVLINLKRRPDRLANFRRLQEENGWPLPEPAIFEALEGNHIGVPTYYQSGGGAWGCLLSHCEVLQRARMDKVSSILMLEDDVVWHKDFGERLKSFMGVVPRDWDQLMLGGQHIGGSPAKVCEGVVRCKNCQRTHAYAIRGEAARDLLKLWYACNRHIDHQMGPWQKGWKVYAPDPFIMGQDRGKSDISGRENPAKFWTPPQRGASIVHLTAPPAVARLLRAPNGPLHMGYTRDKDDMDKGLNAVKTPANLRRWIEVINWEVASAEGLTACVWHPKIPLTMLREVYTEGPVVEVVGETVEECMAQLANGSTTAIRKSNWSDSHVVVLRCSREVAEELKGRGFHLGNWRDQITGHDNGLREIALLAEKTPKLSEWFDLLTREASSIPGGVVAVWHPEISLDDVARATDRKVVELTGDAREILAKWKEVTT